MHTVAPGAAPVKPAIIGHDLVSLALAAFEEKGDRGVVAFWKGLTLAERAVVARHLDACCGASWQADLAPEHRLKWFAYDCWKGVTVPLMMELRNARELEADREAIAMGIQPVSGGAPLLADDFGVECDHPTLAEIGEWINRPEHRGLWIARHGRPATEAVATYEPTAMDLALLHGDDHDAQPDPLALECWSQAEADYWADEYELWDEAEAIAREREAEIAYREAMTVRDWSRVA